MKKIITLLLACLLFSAVALPAFATEPMPHLPAVAQTEDALKEALGKDTPGAAITLILDGNIEMMEGFGYEDLASGALVTPDTAFEIGDLSGSFAAVAAVLAADTGKLSLDADISVYLDAAFMSKLALKTPLTLRDLLLGRGGFDGRLFDLAFDDPNLRFITLREALLADVPKQVLPTGSCSLRSPFSMALAAYVVECAVGLPYEVYLRDAVLIPLGMHHTFPNPTGEEEIPHMAKGYHMTAEGSFSLPQNGGRTYAGLYPATGAVSTLFDITRYLSFLLSPDAHGLLSPASHAVLFESVTTGLFSASGLGFSADGNLFLLQGKTDGFGAALCFDRNSGRAVAVLTNEKNSSLLSLPYALMGRGSVASVPLPEGELLPLKQFRGTFVSAALERRSFVGRLEVIQHQFVSKDGKDGILEFLDMRLLQVAPGVFAKADDPAAVPVLHFLLDEEGEVLAAVTADGHSFLPIPFYYAHAPATLLLALLVLLAVWFSVAGVFAVIRYVARRDTGEGEGVLVVLPTACSAVLGLLSILQIFIAFKFGVAPLTSFFGAAAVLSLLTGIAATVGYLIAFLVTVTNRRVHQRVAVSGILFVVYFLLLYFWGLVL